MEPALGSDTNQAERRPPDIHHTFRTPTFIFGTTTTTTTTTSPGKRNTTKTKMPICCIGGICIPWNILFPLFCVLFRPVYKVLPKLFQDKLDAVYAYIMWAIDYITPAFMKGKKKDKKKPCCDAEGKEIPAVSAPFERGGMVILEEDHSVEEMLASGPVLLYFTAVWCGPCNKVKPEVKSLATKAGKLLVVAVDVDNHPDVAQEHRVNAMPTFVHFDNGKEVQRAQGAPGLSKFDFGALE